MAEEVKKIRATAKSRFTRKRKEFLKAVTENKGIDTVKRTFAKLNEAWNLQELYSEAAAMQAQYVNDQIQLEKKQREEINRQGIIRIEQEKFQRLLEQMNMKKKSMETIFETLSNHAQNLMESKGQDASAALRKTSKELETALANCNELHNKMLELLDSKSVEHEIEWIRKVHLHCNEISGRIESFIAKERDLDNAQTKIHYD